MKRLMIAALLSVFALSGQTSAEAQTNKTRKTQDTTQRTRPESTHKHRPLNKGMDSVTLYPHDSIPGKDINGR